MLRFAKRLYNQLIAPRQHDEDTRNRELVLNVLLSGTLFILLLTLLLLVVKMLVLGTGYLANRTAGVTVMSLFVAILVLLSRRGWHRTVSYLLVGVYFLVATILIMQWGIAIPSAALLYGLVIVLAGILLGSIYSIYANIAAIVTLTFVQLGTREGWLTPDQSWMVLTPGFTDVAGYAFILSVIALVSWLFNFKMERSLHRVERAEIALLKQKDLLETTVEQRTRQLQAAQLEKIQQMYRFAELGQLSTALLHDLANHLTTLTMDIGGLQGTSQSRALSRAKRSVRYIEEMVVRVRRQLHGEEHIRYFAVSNEIDAVVSMLNHRGVQSRVTIEWQRPAQPKGLRCQGDPVRFRQCMANLVSNAIDAYADAPETAAPRKVSIKAEKKADAIIITVGDWGIGIPVTERAKLFEPFYSTKKTGMGMGLYIVKQVVEEHFLGTVAIDPEEKHTVFVVTLPAAGA